MARLIGGLLVAAFGLHGVGAAAQAGFGPRTSLLPVSRPASVAFATDVSTNTVAQAPTGSANAAAWYLQAVNAYQRRRRPKGSLAAGYEGLSLPPLRSAELCDLAIGARQVDADFYVERDGAPALRIVTAPGAEPVPMAASVNTLRAAPHAEPFQAFAMATVREAERRFRAGRADTAQAICGRLVRLGAHLRQRPGSLTDVDAGIRIEQMALQRWLLCVRPNDVARITAIRAYGRSLERLQARVRSGYAGLGDPATCRKVLASGSDRLWRVLAASALTQAARLRTTSPEAREVIVNALRGASLDADGAVSRAAAFQLSRLRRATMRPAVGRALRG